MKEDSTNSKPRRGRTRTRRREIDTTVASPCIMVCRLHGDTCVGCGRSTDEIRSWIIMTAQEQQGVLTASKNRLEALPVGVRVSAAAA